jgi:hypothetical protein
MCLDPPLLLRAVPPSMDDALVAPPTRNANVLKLDSVAKQAKTFR